MKELTVSAKDAGGRLDKYLQRYLDLAPKSFLYKMLRKKNITRNGAKAEGSDPVNEGDRICLYLSDETIGAFQSGAEKNGQTQRAGTAGTAIPLPQILYEDEACVIFNKPAGLLTQGDKSGDESLAGLLDRYMAADGGNAGESFFHASPAHRLDRNTSGIVMCGKTLRGQQMLTEMLKRRTVRKYYLAAVLGKVTKDGRYRVSFRKDEAGNRVILNESGDGGMITAFRVLSTSEAGGFPKGTSLLRVELITGKPHQIRAHLAFLGHPVLGDPKYGDAGANRILRDRYKVRRQLLHASEAVFPDEEEIAGDLAGRTVRAELPDDMKRILKQLGLTEQFGIDESEV